MIKPETIENKMSMTLYYDDQLKFKKFIKRHLGFKPNFYFDGVCCVDCRTQHDIRGVYCNGSMTWQNAYDKLKKHFKV